MEWATLKHSKKAVNRAGLVLCSESPNFDEYVDALTIISNWRACHNFPLNTFQSVLRGKVQKIDNAGIVAQRIKRLPSIELKLKRFPKMTLSQMQDIGGCRAVLSTVAGVNLLVKNYKTGKSKHQLVREDNYITSPKDSGYRGVHMIYRYFSEKKPDYNGLQIELQIRSQMQHIWATAVETVGTFTQQALKSSQGSANWLRLFALMGSVFAIHERSPGVPGVPKDRKSLLEELEAVSLGLNAESLLQTYGQSVQILGAKANANAHYFLLQLNAVDRKLIISAFPRSDSEEAEAAYLQAEKRMKDEIGGQAVLVSVERLAQLKKAYPNYFLDTHNFVRLLRNTLARKRLNLGKLTRSARSGGLFD